MALSQKDQEILNRIFNPTLTTESDSDLIEDDDFVIPNYPAEVKRLEILAVKEAESNSLPLALELIDQAIKLCPEASLASLYNNKAQILRLQGDLNQSLHLLNQSISLASSSLNNRVLRLSSAQRAWIHFRAGKMEEAFKDFEVAAKLGCGESRRMAVRCNPYAAMCNQFMQEILGSTFYSK